MQNCSDRPFFTRIRASGREMTTGTPLTPLSSIATIVWPFVAEVDCICDYRVADDSLLACLLVCLAIFIVDHRSVAFEQNI